MRLRLPTPKHGWRALGGEVGIIVLGVFIALVAQQLVDDARERAESREARKLIREELADYIGRLESWESVKPCVTRRLSELQSLLDDAQQGGPIETPKWIGRTQFWTLLTVRWDAAAQSGRAALIPANELALYGTMYDWMASTYDSMLIEQADWAKLRTLEHLSALTPDMAFELNATLQDARYRAYRISSQIKELRVVAKKVDLPVRKNVLTGTQGMCLPMTTPRELAVRSSLVGEP